MAIRSPLLPAFEKMVPDHINGKGWLKRAAVDGHRRYQRIVGLFDSDERQELLASPSRQSDGSLLEPFFSNGRSHVEARMDADIETYLCDDILVKVDRNSMYNSLEVRVPLLDHRIVEFATSLPLDYRIYQGVQKYILKDLLSKHVPKELTDRPKRGFGLPLKHWLRATYKEFAYDLLAGPDTRIAEVLDGAVVKRYLDGHQKGKRDLSHKIWGLMCLEQWLRVN
jgi:asparagine synthase (glutamine-hydrolysing)